MAIFSDICLKNVAKWGRIWTEAPIFYGAGGTKPKQ
jgi:hypothetical protein